MRSASLAFLPALLLAAFSASAGPIIETRLPPVQAQGGGQEPGAPTHAEARKQWQLGRIALGNGDLKAAEAAFKQATQLDPKAGAPWVGLGDVALRRGEMDGAKMAVQEALKRDPTHTPARLGLARLALMGGKTEEGEALLKALLQKEPNFVPALVDLGEVMANSGRLTEAEPLFKRATEQAGAGLNAWINLARSQAQQGRRPDAMATLEKAAAQLPGNAMPWVAASEMALSMGDKATALRHAGQAVQSDGKSVQAQVALADALVANDQVAKALDGLQSYLSVPGVPVALVHTKVAAIKTARKDLDGAMAAYRLALRADAKFHPALNNMAWLSAERKQDLDEALRAARRAVELQPNQPSYVDTLAFVLLARKDRKEALAVLTKAVAARPKVALLHLRLAQTHQAMDELAKARESVDLALKLEPNFKEAQELKKKLGGGQG